MVLRLRYADPSVSGFVGIVAIAKLCLCALHNLIRIILLITPVTESVSVIYLPKAILYRFTNLLKANLVTEYVCLWSLKRIKTVG